jgi:hypothetical protein
MSKSHNVFLLKINPYFHTPYLPQFLSILNNLIITLGLPEEFYITSLTSKGKGAMKKNPEFFFFEDEHVGITKCHQQTPTPLLVYPIFSSFFIVYFK